MRRYVLILGCVVASVVVMTAGSPKSDAAAGCTPAYYELEQRVTAVVGVTNLSFRLLAIGCKEGLGAMWPPEHGQVEEKLLPELQEPHPVQILLMIRERSPDLRARLAAKLNQEVFGGPIVFDVFLFDGKAEEH